MKQAQSPVEALGGRGHAEALTPHKYNELQANAQEGSALKSSLLPHSKKRGQATGALSLEMARWTGFGRQQGATGGGGGEKSSNPTWGRSGVRSQLVRAAVSLSATKIMAKQ